MFSIGDTVCYPLHGVGTIEAIEERKVYDRTATYYVIRLTNTRMTALLPIETAESVGLRWVVSGEIYPDLVRYYKTTDADIGDSNWNQRYRDNMEKLRKGDPYSLIDVILCLTKRNRMRALSSQERKMLSNAKSILVAELAVATGLPGEEIEQVFSE